MELSAFVLAAPDEGAVVIRGKSYTVGVLSDWEEQAIRRCFAVPVAPMAPEAGKGSLAPWAPNERDPAFVEAVREWNGNVSAVEAAVALGLTINGSTFDACADADRKVWAASAAAGLRKSYTVGEIGAVLREVRRLSNPVKLEESAVKN